MDCAKFRNRSVLSDLALWMMVPEARAAFTSLSALKCEMSAHTRQCAYDMSQQIQFFINAFHVAFTPSQLCV